MYNQLLYNSVEPDACSKERSHGCSKALTEAKANVNATNDYGKPSFYLGGLRSKAETTSMMPTTMNRAGSRPPGTLPSEMASNSQTPHTTKTIPKTSPNRSMGRPKNFRAACAPSVITPTPRSLTPQLMSARKAIPIQMKKTLQPTASSFLTKVLLFLTNWSFSSSAIGLPHQFIKNPQLLTHYMY